MRSYPPNGTSHSPDCFHVGFGVFAADHILSLHRVLSAATETIRDVEDYRPTEDYVTFRCLGPRRHRDRGRLAGLRTGHTMPRSVDRIILEAKRVLAHCSDPVARISDDLGFDEPTNFVKYFKRDTNLTATQFRDSLLMTG